MKEKIDNGILWNAAGKTGLVFGLFSGACLTAKQFLALYWDAPKAVTLLSGVLWAVEFFGCIWMMAFFMRKLCADYAGVTGMDTRRYGRRIALCSALILAGINLLLVLTVSGDATEAAMEEAMQTYGSYFDANAKTAFDDMRDKLPALTFFSQFLWAWLYGCILSGILSRFIPGQGSSQPSDQDSDPL